MHVELKLFSAQAAHYLHSILHRDKIRIIESQLVQIFDNNNENYYIYLEPNTPRYHANMLFNKMIDYCIENELTDHLDRPLINKAFRNSFYKFCYENSNK